MIEEKLEKMEGLLTQLITMVGTLNNTQQDMHIRMQTMEKNMQTMQKDMQTMQNDMQTMQKDMQTMASKSEVRHDEVVSRLKTLEMDQDYIWEKPARNERELGVLKRRLS